MRRTEITRFLPTNVATHAFLKMGSKHGLPSSVIRIFLPLVFAFMWGLQADAQCTLVCNDDAQVSLRQPDLERGGWDIRGTRQPAVSVSMLFSFLRKAYV